MFIKKYLKKRMLISMISVIMIVVTIFFTSYALFMDITTNTTDQTIAVGDLQITFLNGNKIDIENITPMNDANGMAQTNNIYVFTINNIGNLAYHYMVSLLDTPNITANLLPHEFIRFSLDGGAPRVLSDYIDGIIYEGVLNPANNRTFTLQIWVGGRDQTNPILGMPNEALGSEVHLNINVDGRAGFDAKGPFGFQILNDNGGMVHIVNRGTPDFNTLSTTATGPNAGMFATADNFGTSYYFRGSHELNNNVIFAGHQWKIIRIDGAGNIRMIYNGVCPNNICTINGNTAGPNASVAPASNFNATVIDNRHVGYMHGTSCTTYQECHANEVDSTVKGRVDGFISSLPTEAQELLVPTIFCSDRSLRGTGTGIGDVSTQFGSLRRIDDQNPSLYCEQPNDRLMLKGALITADEVAMAGGRRGQANPDFFVRSGQLMWTMSPNNTISNVIWMNNVNPQGILNISQANSNAGVRPVISLTSNITATGNGSRTNPYIIQLP